jgi:hypothetical protein
MNDVYTIPVGRLAPTKQWDQNMLDLLFANDLYYTGLNFSRHEGYPIADGAIIIIPGRYWHEQANQISECIAKYRWVLAIRTGDEEDLFDPERVFHRNIKWWVQSPKPGHDYGDARLIGVGFPPHFNDIEFVERGTGVFLSAQNTHDLRNQCFAALEPLDVPKVIHPTTGFTHGMDKSKYVTCMCAAKIAPAPSGPVTADNFRLFEALEAHTVPIADNKDFWLTLFPDAPFPIVDNYEQLPGYIRDQLEEWPANSNRITAWWMHQKRQLSKWLLEDLMDVGAL